MLAPTVLTGIVHILASPICFTNTKNLRPFPADIFLKFLTLVEYSPRQLSLTAASERGDCQVHAAKNRQKCINRELFDSFRETLFLAIDIRPEVC